LIEPRSRMWLLPISSDQIKKKKKGKNNQKGFFLNWPIIASLPDWIYTYACMHSAIDWPYCLHRQGLPNTALFINRADDVWHKCEYLYSPAPIIYIRVLSQMNTPPNIVCTVYGKRCTYMTRMACRSGRKGSRIVTSPRLTRTKMYSDWQSKKTFKKKKLPAKQRYLMQMEVARGAGAHAHYPRCP